MEEPNRTVGDPVATPESRDRNTAQRPAPSDLPFDEADWVDWDHWQTVEEIQNFMNGLSETAESSLDVSEDEPGYANAATQLRKHGLQTGE